MSIGFTQESGISIYDGQIAAFADINDNGSLECVGLSTILDGFTGIGLWGDDTSTPEIDGLQSGDMVTFMIILESGFIPIDVSPNFQGYTSIIHLLQLRVGKTTVVE